jgi:hypothetical protein
MMPLPRLSIAVAAVLLLASTMTGCSNTAPELQQATATQLEAGVLKVTVAAAAGEFTDAQTALDAVQADLLAAAAADRVSAARSAQIQSAINLVTADLTAAIDESTPTPTPTPTSVDKGKNRDNGKCKKKDDCGD